MEKNADSHSLEDGLDTRERMLINEKSGARTGWLGTFLFLAVSVTTVLGVYFREHLAPSHTVSRSLAIGERKLPKIAEETLARFREHKFDPKIVGGTQAQISDAPWQILLVDYDESYWPSIVGYNYWGLCGGSIISSDWIVTAAHCVESPGLWKYIRVAAGQTYRLGEFSTGISSDQFIRVSEIYVHPDYNDSTFENDIALMRLSSPLNVNGNTIKAINIPVGLPKGWPIANTDALITGWGTLSSGGSTPNQLMKATATIYGGKCGDYGSSFDKKSMLCAGSLDGTVDTCQGDSGGPLAVYEDSSAKWFLGGITSWGMDCAAPKYPGIYTRVTTYLDWIARTTDPSLIKLSITLTGDGDGLVASKPDGISCGQDKAACNAAFSAGSKVTLTATPEADSKFKGWSGACTGKKPTCKVTLSAATQVSAKFIDA